MALNPSVVKVEIKCLKGETELTSGLVEISHFRQGSFPYLKISGTKFRYKKTAKI